MNKAIFLDRGSVPVEDANPDAIRILDVVPQALRSLQKAGFKLTVLAERRYHISLTRDEFIE